MHFSPMQLILILIIVVLLFGTKKLGNMGSDLGSAFKNFKKAMREDDDESAPSSSAPNTPKISQNEGRVIDSEAKEKDKV